MRLAPGGRATFICVPGTTPGPRSSCPHAVHDHPLPADYLGASEEADRRLRARWKNTRCPECKLYGWSPPA